jgi:hypothetical protein
MNMRRFYTALAMALLMWNAQAYEGEGIVLDPATGNYIITYMGDEDRLMQTTFVPATKIMPSVRSAFRLDKDFTVTYRYSVSNASTAPNPIDTFMVDDVVNPIIGELPFPHEAMYRADGEVSFKAYHDAEKANIASPPSWEAGFARGSGLKRIHWGEGWNPVTDTRIGKPILAGDTLSGFGFKSIDLPGVGESKLRGGLALFGYPDDGPDEDSPIFEQINKLRDNDHVVRSVAVPTISLPAVFDAAVVVDRIREHVATWPSKQLADATVAAQLDAELLATASAYRANQPQVARDHIEILLDLIRREHKDIDRDDDDEHDNKRGGKESDRKVTSQPIRLDRLAARVLDFDLKYVLKRMKKDDEHEHERKNK